MATFSISGNIVNSSGVAQVNEIVYIQNLNSTCAVIQPSPTVTQTDGSGNFTFSGLIPGNYQIFTSGKKTAPLVIPVTTGNVTNVNFSA